MLKKILAVGISLIIMAVIGAGFYFLYSSHKLINFTYLPNQDAHATSGNFGTDFSRIDSQITLKIPEGKAQEVYAYLRENYVDQNRLKEVFPKLKLGGEKQADISEFTDDYFDTNYLDLYQTNNTVRFRNRENTVNQADPKSGKELVQVKITPADRFDLRNELKFKVAKAKNKPPKSQTRTVLFDLIDPTLKDDFKIAVAPMNPYSLRQILTFKQTRNRVYLDWDQKNFLSFSVDEGEAGIWWAKGKISSVDIGLVETAYTEADETKREQMREIDEWVIKDLQSHFPELVKNSEDKYVIILSQLIEQIPGFKIWRWLEAI